MVAPQQNNPWAQFQRPSDINNSQEVNTRPQQQMSFPQQEEQQQAPSLEEQPEQKLSWGDFQTPTTYQGEVDPEDEESAIGTVGRNLAQLGSRVTEQVLGYYGNIEKSAKNLLADVPQSAGLLGWGLSKLIGEDKWKRLIHGGPQEKQMIPTSEDLKQASSKLTGGYTDPKGKSETAISETVEDIAALLRGGGRTGWMKNLGIPVIANTAKQVVKETGFGEDKANIAKAAVWLPMMLADSVNGPRYASQLMNQGRNQTPANLQFDVPRLQQRLQQIQNDPMLLRSDPRTLLARQQIAAIEQDLANGMTTQRALMNAYDGINAAKRSRSMFELGRNDQNFARRAIDRVRDAVGDEIRLTGRQTPQALQNWQNGLTAWATVHRSNALTNWIQRAATGPYAKILTGPAAGLFGIGAYGASKSPLVTLTGAGAAPAAYKTGQILYRAYNNPTLRNYYFNAINAANAENLPVFLHNYQKLNKEIEKQDRQSAVRDSIKPSKKSDHGNAAKK